VPKYPSIPDASKIEDLPTRQVLIAIKQDLELLTGRLGDESAAVTQEELIDLGLVTRAPNGTLQIPDTTTTTTTSTRFRGIQNRGVQVAPKNLGVKQLVGRVAFAQWEEAGYPDYSHSQLLASNIQDSSTAEIVADNVIGNVAFTLPQSINPILDVYFWSRNVAKEGYPGPFDTGDLVGTLWTTSTLFNPLAVGKFWDATGGLIIENIDGLTPIPLDNNFINTSDLSHTPGDAFVTILTDGWYRIVGTVTYEEQGFMFGFHQFRTTLQVDTGGGFIDIPLGFSLSGGRHHTSDSMNVLAREQFVAGDKIQMAFEVITLPGRAVTVADGSVMRIQRLA